MGEPVKPDWLDEVFDRAKERCRHLPRPILEACLLHIANTPRPSPSEGEVEQAIEALRKVAPLVCRQLCPHDTQQIWPHDPICIEVQSALTNTRKEGEG